MPLNKFYINLGKIKIYMRDTFRYLYKDSSNFINSCLLGIKDDLTKEEKENYLNINIDESNRLTSLSTNILNLSKIEKQEIVTNKKKVNIGEQIRKVVLIEYKKN